MFLGHILTICCLFESHPVKCEDQYNALMLYVCLILSSMIMNIIYKVILELLWEFIWGACYVLTNTTFFSSRLSAMNLLLVMDEVIFKQ